MQDAGPDGRLREDGRDLEEGKGPLRDQLHSRLYSDISKKEDGNQIDFRLARCFEAIAVETRGVILLAGTGLLAIRTHITLWVERNTYVTSTDTTQHLNITGDLSTPEAVLHTAGRLHEQHRRNPY